MTVRYRLTQPEAWDPPIEHFPLENGGYLAPYDPTIELLDEYGIIDVKEWGLGG